MPFSMLCKSFAHFSAYLTRQFRSSAKLTELYIFGFIFHGKIRTSRQAKMKQTPTDQARERLAPPLYFAFVFVCVVRRMQ